MEEVEIPSYFLCPISLEMMRDPVTLSTGITYDRGNIDRWIFDMKQKTCPVTKQPLMVDDIVGELTPNHTLRRLIQAWCTLNSSHGVERIPTPRSPVDKAQIAELLEDAKLPQSQLVSLRKLKQIAAESERNKRCVEATPGVVDFLASTIVNHGTTDRYNDEFGCASAGHEALVILHMLQISEEGFLDLAMKNPNMVESLATILQRSNYESRTYAMLILKSLLRIISPARVREELLEEMVNVIRDGISLPATKAALHALVGACRWGRSRIKAVQAGAVHVLVEMLLENPEKRVCELALSVLDVLCQCAEGRAELVRHRGAVAVVSKKILRVSHLASEKAVRILSSVARYSATASVLQEMVQVGAVSKLCMVIQAGSGGKAEEKAMEMLRLHSREWGESPCFSPLFNISSHPCS